MSDIFLENLFDINKNDNKVVFGSLISNLTLTFRKAKWRIQNGGYFIDKLDQFKRK